MTTSNPCMTRLSVFKGCGVLVMIATAMSGMSLMDRLAVVQPLVRSIRREGSKGGDMVAVLDEELPQVAWLMTFPNSGTTYTLKLIQQYTNTTTATNYGNEQGVHGTSISVHPSMEYGPYSRHPTFNLPPRYILTKTHCGGTAMSPLPRDYIETERSFEIACRSGNRMMNDEKEEVVYDISIPKRAVHLIRSPFDNIVARLHHAEKKWAGSEEKSEQLSLFNATKEGFRAWCREIDARSVDKEQKSRYFDEELWQIAQNVPCHAEFMRYTWWHNHASELLRRQELPVHALFYEDYASDWRGTVNRLLDFLHLSPAEGAQPLEFLTGKHYEDYFEPADIVTAKRLVESLASPETWALVKRYFP